MRLKHCLTPDKLSEEEDPVMRPLSEDVEKSPG
jgi:hypothetical protein